MSATRTDPSRYVICIGSQRAGTTLLHRVLNDASPVFMHPLKEVHYFDTLFELRPFVTLHRYCEHVSGARSPRSFDRLRRRRASLEERTRSHALRLVLRCESAEDLARIPYRDLFLPATGHVRILGEATPEYMRLPPAGIRAMRDAVGSNARIVLLRRDPVQRFISSYVLRHAYLQDFDPSALDERVMLDQVRGRVGWLDEQVAYSDYDWALAAYEAFFPHVLDLRLEELSSGDPAVAVRLSEFLDAPVDRWAYAAVVGTKKNALAEFRVSEAARAELAELLAGYMTERRLAGRP